MQRKPPSQPLAASATQAQVPDTRLSHDMLTAYSTATENGNNVHSEYLHSRSTATVQCKREEDGKKKKHTKLPADTKGLISERLRVSASHLFIWL